MSSIIIYNQGNVYTVFDVVLLLRAMTSNGTYREVRDFRQNLSAPAFRPSSSL